MCEAPSLFRANAHRARVPHQCDECLREIATGELYEYAWGIWEGRPEHYETCAECWEVRDDLRDDMLSSGVLFDEEIACDLAFGNLPYALANECAEMK